MQVGRLDRDGLVVLHAGDGDGVGVGVDDE